MKAKKYLIPLLILVVGFVAMRSLISLRTTPPKRTPAPRTRIVETAVMETGDIPAEIIAYGRLTSAQPVVLYSEATGTVLEGDVPFQPAQSFRKGDLLLKIDDRQIRLDQASARSDLMTALAPMLPEIKVDFPDEYQTWQDYFNSCSFDGKLAPLPETRNQKIKLYLSRFSVYKLYFTAQNLQIRLEKHKFYAPFSGSIVTTDLRVRSTARAGMFA